MKKLLFTLAIIALPSLVLAQSDMSAKQQREARREARTLAFENKMITAVTEKNFSFFAQTISTNMSPSEFVNGVNNYVSVYPKFMDVVLPTIGKSWTDNPAFNLNLYVSPYTYKISTQQEGYLNVSIGFTNAMGDQPENATRDFTYNFDFSIDLKSGSATLMITPQFGTPISYSGYVQLNN